MPDKPEVDNEPESENVNQHVEEPLILKPTAVDAIKGAAAVIKGLIDVQRQPGNYDHDRYMFGMLIGLECAYFCILEEEATYTPTPARFIVDIPKVKSTNMFPDEE